MGAGSVSMDQDSFQLTCADDVYTMYTTMTRMIRKQVYIRPAQDKMLKRRARELGVTESDVIRRGIERSDELVSVRPLDRKAWQEELHFIRERARIQALGKTRGWTRDELYDRHDRFSR